MGWKIFVLAALTAAHLYEAFLMYLSRRSGKNPVPENVKDVYDPEGYARWRAYHGEKNRIGGIRSAAAFAAAFLLFLLNAHSAFARIFPGGAFAQTLAVLLLAALSDLVTLPVDWYDTMVLEEKYGFNRTDRKTFFSDAIKQFLVSLVIMLLIALVLMWVHRSLGAYMIPAFAAVMILFSLAVSFLFPVFAKLFNKFTPLEDRELETKLTALLEKNGYRVRAIRVMDASRRTTKSNAYFTGFGKMKTIVLYDNLVNAMTADEVCAVFAHEMGHGLHKDTLRNQIFSMIRMTFLAVLAYLTLRTDAVFTGFGFAGINYGFAMLVIMNAEFALLSPLFSFPVNAMSRCAEYRADAQAAKEGYGTALITALKKLTRENFGDLSPDPLLVKLTYSHPTLSQRIAAIETGTDRTDAK